jgi:hypothetical protein
LTSSSNPENLIMALSLRGISHPAPDPLPAV